MMFRPSCSVLVAMLGWGGSFSCKRQNLVHDDLYSLLAHPDVLDLI